MGDGSDLGLMAVAGVAFLLAGFVKGVIGLGLPTVAIGVLSLVVSPAQAAALLVVPSLVTNVWQLAGPGLARLLGRLWPMLVGVCIGTAAGAALGILTGDAEGPATTALGVALVLYAGLGLTPVRFSVAPDTERWASPLIGAATGLVTAATGVFVIPAVPYLQALGLEKDDLVQALGVSFLVSTLALAAVLARDGAFEASVAGGSLLAVAPALAGMAAGQRLRGRVSPARFRIWFFVGLLVLGGHLAARHVL